MPKKEEFVLKDSDPEFIKAAGVQPRGREYDAARAKKPGAVRIDEVLLGTKLACISITDDNEGTLATVGKMNPWHIEALKMITGSEEEAHKPLTHILDKHFNLKCDKILDLSGWSGGRPIDTQGYIAHNDEMIVVSFRCTTSALDWMTNLATTSSEWELDEDVAQGHSGMLSCFEGRCFVKGPKKPRVHTGFYNNILKTIPYLQEHVDPLLAPDQPARKLYVVGHSLGAGISTMATCYFLQHHDWAKLPHKFINVSAGTPRSCKQPMADIMEAKLSELRPLDKAIVCRVVMNEDVVAKVPPLAIGYTHIGKLVFLTEDGHVLVGPKRSDSHIVDEEEMQELCKTNPQLIALAAEKEKEEGEDDMRKSKLQTEYEAMMTKIPRPIRDHCPDFYLAPLIKLYERDNEAELPAQ
mmetsp:Transcript_6025/g.16899  ORF Transcript_6025/g.16899 Transcript_6025/m.16899 type:complete len:411 (-) Transcript_6025:136-1368(-)|eukprot:CAMPEP_0181056590 /NCGR_PEP_ID=MMETSP1070-20121207/19801_1 /TAXON_ID=265543 /ORGANISM="Minutocellus polymorphus, Strain NH13" /LENGTH=410 /DNA_ID=CAMNT_0023135953 /DNA_START=514 /DNA_END=1746 /DNA_ORIENTATION=-